MRIAVPPAESFTSSLPVAVLATETVHEVELPDTVPVVAEAVPTEPDPWRIARKLGASALVIGIGVSAYGLAQPEAAHASTTVPKLTRAQEKKMTTACGTDLATGHRGQVGPNAAIGPDEDTSRALIRAYRIGAKAGETDFNLDASGTWYSIHDSSVNRTTNGSGMVANKTDAQMNRLHTPDGSSVPSEQHLGQVYNHADNGKYAKQQRELVWELKPQPAAAQMGKKDIQNFVDVINQEGLHDVMSISSLSLHNLELVHEVDPTIPLQLIAPVGQSYNPSKVPSFISRLNVDYTHAMKSYGNFSHYIGAARAAGFSVSERLATTASQYVKFMLAGGKQLMLNKVAGYVQLCKQVLAKN